MGSYRREEAGIDEWAAPLADGVAILLRAHRYANELNVDPWDFAVELEEMRRVGVASSDLRWLLAQGYVAHAEEITTTDGEKRVFESIPEHRLPANACFTLTAEGLKLASQLGFELPPPRPSPQHVTPAGKHDVQRQNQNPLGTNHSHLALKPSWNVDFRELRVGNRIVKRFKWPAINQETILAAFQEEAWPSRIDDPLPPIAEADPQSRLHDTIKCLNRNQQARLIRFRGDGTGQGVSWELLRPGQE